MAGTDDEVLGDCCFWGRRVDFSAVDMIDCKAWFSDSDRAVWINKSKTIMPWLSVVGFSLSSQNGRENL